MAATFQVIAISSLDPEGSDTCNEPMLLYPDALKTARQFKADGKEFRVIAKGEQSEQ